MGEPKKTVLVVGSSGGIGNKVAEVLLESGYSVIGTYFNDKEQIDRLKENVNFSSFELNLQDKDSVEQLQKSISNSKIFAIVNCAGICIYEDSDVDSNLSIWDKTIAVNLSGNYYLAQFFKELLSENGRFIMISSTDSYYGGVITSSYAASKAGVNSLTKSLSLFFKGKGIRVNSIAPGWVNTPMIAGNSEEFYVKLDEINPLKRIAESNDIAKVVKFLLSGDSDYINGQVITVDGGYTNQDPTLLIEEETNK